MSEIKDEAEFETYLTYYRRLTLHLAHIDDAVSVLLPRKYEVDLMAETCCGTQLTGYSKAIEALKEGRKKAAAILMEMRQPLKMQQTAVKICLNAWIDRVIRDIESNH